MKNKAEKIYSVWYRGRRERMKYGEICERLGGYIVEVGFVRVTSAGTICFWCGKPEDVKALRFRAEQNGFVPSKALAAAAGAYDCGGVTNTFRRYTGISGNCDNWRAAYDAADRFACDKKFEALEWLAYHDLKTIEDGGYPEYENIEEYLDECRKRGLYPNPKFERAMKGE